MRRFLRVYLRESYGLLQSQAVFRLGFGGEGGIRTSAEITAHIKIFPVHQPYLYQKLSQKAAQLRLLGMSYQQIAKSLNINKRTAMKACRLDST